MSAAIVIGVLIAAGKAHAPDGAALVAALTEVVGPGPSIIVQKTAPLTDDQIGAMARELHTTALVAVEPQQASHDVSLRILIVSADRWIVRRINFSPRDTAIERGRAVGLTAAAILLDEVAVVPAALSAATEKQPRAPARSVNDPNPPTVVARRDSSIDSGRPYHYAVDLSALASTGIAGDATGFGGASHLELAFNDNIWPRFGGGVRLGSVPGLDGDDLVTWAAFGVAWRMIHARAVGQLGLSTSLDAGLVMHRLSHDRPNGTSADVFRFLPQVSLMIQGSWRVARYWEAVFAVGTEVAFGSIDLWVAARPVARIPWVRGLASIGARFGW